MGAVSLDWITGRACYSLNLGWITGMVKVFLDPIAAEPAQWEQETWNWITGMACYSRNLGWITGMVKVHLRILERSLKANP